MAKGASEESAKLQRKLFRQNIHRIWGMVKSGRRNELSERDHHLAEILMEHEECRDHFENTDILDGREYEAGATFNPFLHISTHRMVEDQLLADSPAEAAIFCETMEGRGFSRHEVIHFIIRILLHVMYASASDNRPFDAARYKRLLTRCKTSNPLKWRKSSKRISPATYIGKICIETSGHSSSGFDWSLLRKKREVISWHRPMPMGFRLSMRPLETCRTGRFF